VENWVEVQMTAGNMWKSGYKYSKQQVQQLMEDVKRYKIHEEPYDCMPVDGELATLKLYWKVILSTGSNLELPKLAVLLLDIKPHAADPEKTVSLMGWYHSARRSKLLSATTTAMTTVKMHYQTVKDRWAIVSGNINSCICTAMHCVLAPPEHLYKIHNLQIHYPSEIVLHLLQGCEACEDC